MEHNLATAGMFAEQPARIHLTEAEAH